jgi:hypothetical protein
VLGGKELLFLAIIQQGVEVVAALDVGALGPLVKVGGDAGAVGLDDAAQPIPIELFPAYSP